jgi:hypothetical protein
MIDIRIRSLYWLFLFSNNTAIQDDDIIGYVGMKLTDLEDEKLHELSESEIVNKLKEAILNDLYNEEFESKWN